MQQEKQSLKSIMAFVRRCQVQLKNKNHQLNDKLYEDLINMDDEDYAVQSSPEMHQILINESAVPSQAQTQQFKQPQPQQINQSPSLQPCQQNQPQTLPLHTFMNPHLNQAPFQPIPQQPHQQPIIHSNKSLKLKPNPRMYKFLKPQKHSLKQKQKQLQQKIHLQKHLQLKAKQLQELKKKHIKKFQLKEKLRKLNLELDIEKKHLRSKQKDRSFFNEQNQEHNNSRSDMNPENLHILKPKISTTFIRDNSLIQKSGIRSKSDTEFRIKKLRQQEDMYTPVKHEVAFKLIEKLHAEKLKKHEKIVGEMRKKQEKEIEFVRKLEEEKLKQKNVKRARQVLYYTPQLTRTKKINQIQKNEWKKEQIFEGKAQIVQEKAIREFFRPNSRKITQQLKEHFSLQPSKISQMQQQIGLVIPNEPHSQQSNKQKHQTLYTEQYEQETFQPTTQEGKLFAEALKNSSQNEQAQYPEKEEQAYKEDDFNQDSQKEQVIEKNEFM